MQSKFVRKYIEATHKERYPENSEKPHSPMRRSSMKPSDTDLLMKSPTLEQYEEYFLNGTSFPDPPLPRRAQRLINSLNDVTYIFNYPPDTDLDQVITGLMKEQSF
jgi:hypothetical protein